MNKHSIYLKIIVAFLLTGFLSSCATMDSTKQYFANRNIIQEQTKMAHENIKKGDYYSAINCAFECLDCEENNKECQSIIEDNYKFAIDQIVNEINKIPANVYYVPHLKVKVDELKVFQCKLIDSGFIQSDIVNISELENYEDLSAKIINNMKVLLSKNNFHDLESEIKKYKEVNLPVTDEFVELINHIELSYWTNNKFDELVKFTKANKNYISNDTKKNLYRNACEVAEKEVLKNNKRKAIDMYSFLILLGYNNQDINNKINKLKKELSTFFVILELENSTNEIININNQKFLNEIKSEMEKNNEYAKVVLNDEGIEKFESISLEYNSCYDYIKKQGTSKIPFSKDIKYIIVPKIRAFKIQRRQPSIKTRAFNWNYSVDGNPFKIGANMYVNYGGYKVQYFQCDEYTEKVQGQMILNVLIFDVGKQKRVCEERLQFQIEDTATWGENPVAVGIINKVPATYYPSEMDYLIDVRKKSAMDDDEITKELISKAISKICKKAISLCD